MITFRCPRQDEGPFNYDVASTWRDDHTCSYCGSLSEAEFFRRLEQGEQITPTDKGYKAYIGTDFRRKFYFQHLSPGGKLKFIELLNQRKLNIGPPGYFYVLPFFVSKAP